MNIRRKGAAIGFSATLLASLVATIAAPFASAAVDRVFGRRRSERWHVHRHRDLHIHREFGRLLPHAARRRSAGRNIAPAAPVAGTVTFSGTPVVSAPGSLGATATATVSTLTINFAGSDTLNIEQVSVSGLKITASANATAGAITATLTGTQATRVLGTTATASGHITGGPTSPSVRPHSPSRLTPGRAISR